jgi:glycosyltransferase involved in cell wall biosynthesis
MRGLSFARYLPKRGAQVWVVTAGNASNAYSDPTLVAQIPAEVGVHRTFTPELPYAWRTWIWKRLRRNSAAAAPKAELNRPEHTPSALQRFVRGLATPDPQRVWVPWALRRASRLIRRHAIDTVIVSVPPFSELAVGVELKRRFPALRVVSDFRDEWLDFTLSSVESAGATEKRRAAAELERQAIEASDLVISVTETWTRRIRERYPDQPASKFRCVPNGWDDEVFGGFRPRPHAGKKLVLTYMGTAYARSIYSPEPFLQALDGLDAETLSSIEVRFVGRVEPEIEPLLRNRPYEIVQYGFLPQQEGFRLLEETDALLLFARDPAWQPAKLLEYVATRKPVLAIAPEDGEAAGVLRETGAGTTISPDNPEAIRAAVRMMAQAHRNGSPQRFEPRQAAIDAYSRSALAGRLLEMIQEVGREAGVLVH